MHRRVFVQLSEMRKEQSVVESYINSKEGMTEDLADDIRNYMSITRSQGQSVDMGTVYAMMSHPLKVQYRILVTFTAFTDQKVDYCLCVPNLAVFLASYQTWYANNCITGRHC